MVQGLLPRQRMDNEPPFMYDPSLLLYLPLYELDGNSLLSKDRYGHIATVTGALWRPKDGRWFDHIDDKLQIPDHDSLDSPYRTIIAWINPNYYVSGTVLKLVASKEANYNGGLTINNIVGPPVKCVAAVRFNLSGGGGGQAVVSAVDIQDDYHCIAGSYDGFNLRLAIDGVEDAASPTAWVGTIDINASPLYIGGGVAGRYMANIISEVWEFGRGFSIPELREVYLSTRWRYR